jgi:hypothetical protein
MITMLRRAWQSTRLRALFAPAPTSAAVWQPGQRRLLVTIAVGMAISPWHRPDAAAAIPRAVPGQQPLPGPPRRRRGWPRPLPRPQPRSGTGIAARRPSPAGIRPEAQL